MKKIFTLLMVISLTLTACGGATAPAEPPAPQEPVAEQSEPETPTATPLPPTATSEPIEEAEAMEAAEPTELEIINQSGVEICDIAVTLSDDELSDNILDETLLPDDGLIYADFEAGFYDLLAFDCNDELVAEWTQAELGPGLATWLIDEAEASAAADPPAEEAEGEEAEMADPDVETTENEGPSMEAVAGAQFEAGACPFTAPAGVTLDCGTLFVPENRTQADSPTIELAVAILRAAGNSVAPDPNIFLDGGPGSSALATLRDDFEGWTDYPFHQDHDIIFIDQRGTGWSLPSLNCPEVEEGLDEAERLCQERLVAEGVDLTAYNTAENAADVAALWRVLGYEQANLFGVSYGTRLGFVVMRDHPEGIRSVVLDSPFPPSIDLPTEEGLTNWTAMQEMFRACAQDDPLCAEAYPNLEQLFLETVATLNDDPEAEVTGDDLVNTMVGALYVPELIGLLPRMILELNQGEFETFDIVSAEAGGGASRSRQLQEDEDRSDSEGMFTAVTCRDEYAFGDFDRAEAAALANLPAALQEGLFYSNVGNLFEICAYWGAGAAAPLENEVISSDIPTLILAGQFDPVTPPAWGATAVQSLSNGYFFELPGYGHSLSSDPNCPTTLISQFFADPSVAPDSSCIDEIFSTEFYLPDEPLDF